MTKEQKLNKQVEEQREKISKLSNRLSEMSDRIIILENDVNKFKKNVSSDIKKILSGVPR